MFSFSCDRCGSMLSGEAEDAGTKGRCPTCGADVTVPKIDPRTGIPILPLHAGRHTAPEGTLHAYAAAGALASQIVQSETGEPLIACPNCGQRSDVTADRCTYCQHPFTLEGVSAVAVQAFRGDQVLSIFLGCLALLTIWCVVGAVVAVAGLIHGFLTIRRAMALPATPTLWGCWLGMLLSAGALVIGVVLLLG